MLLRGAGVLTPIHSEPVQHGGADAAAAGRGGTAWSALVRARVSFTRVARVVLGKLRQEVKKTAHRQRPALFGVFHGPTLQGLA